MHSVRVQKLRYSRTCNICICIYKNIGTHTKMYVDTLSERIKERITAKKDVFQSPKPGTATLLHGVGIWWQRRDRPIYHAEHSKGQDSPSPNDRRPIPANDPVRDTGGQHPSALDASVDLSTPQASLPLLSTPLSLVLMVTMKTK